MPEYPQEALDQRLEGVVVLAIDVAAEGSVTRAEVTSAAHPSLGRSAQTAMLQCRFAPGTREGRPIPTTITYKIHFMLPKR